MSQRFTITLEGKDDVQPVVIRLRQALKLLGRAFKLRCIGCREVEISQNVDDVRAGTEGAEYSGECS